MILTKEQIEEQFLDTATDSHEKKYNEGFIDGFLLAQVNNWTVWVGGVEVNDYLLSKEDAEWLAEIYKNNSYADVVIEEIKDES